MNNIGRSRRQAKAGYALPAVLTIVTILTLIYMVCILSLENLRNQTVATVRSAELERSALSAEAQFAYLASTQPLSAKSIQVGGVRTQTSDLFTATSHPTVPTINANVVSPIMLDDAPYLWRENPQDKNSKTYLLSAQDFGGLINLDRVDQATITRLMRVVGLNDELGGQAAASLTAARSPATLSSQEQAQFGWSRPLAPDGLMRRYFEIFGAKDLAQDLTVAQRRRLMNLTYLRPDYASLNINTAPAEALQSWFGLSDIDAAQIVGRRATETFYSLGQIGITATNDSGSYTFPSGGFRFSFMAPKSQELYRSTILLTPGSFERPFWIEDARVQPTLQPTSSQTDGLQPFPTAPANASEGDGRLEVLDIQGALLGGPIVALARERCLFEPFNAAAARSNSAALTAARLHAEVAAPYQSPGFLITQAGRSFGIWWWDADWVLAQLEANEGDPDSTILPETLLNMPGSGVRLLKLTSGFEAQAWENNYLIADLWRRNAFDEDGWASFMRQLPAEMQAPGTPPAQRIPLVLDSPYRRSVVSALITRDTAVLAGCVAVSALLAVTAYLAGSGISLNRQADQLRVQTAAEQTKIADRMRGQSQIAQLQVLQREIGRPDAFTLLGKAQAVILPFGYKIDVFSANRRSVSVTLPEEAVAGVDLICTELNSSPYFQNASPKLDHAKKKLIIDMDVRGAGDLKVPDPAVTS